MYQALAIACYEVVIPITEKKALRFLRVWKALYASIEM